VKTVLIVDGDILKYRHASTAEKRSVEVIHKASGRIKTFKNRTEFKEFLREKKYDYVAEDYTFKDEIVSLGVVPALSCLKAQINHHASELFADEIQVYISGSSNFRDNLALPSKYKGQRVNNIKPVHLKDFEIFLKKEFGAIECNGYEADDAVVFKGYEVLARGDIPIVMTIDKDIMSSSGLYVLRFTEKDPKPHLISDFGFLNYEEGKTTGEGFLWLCYQWVRGDPTDNFNPAEIAKVKFGDKAGYDLLHDAVNHKEALQRVVNKYKEWYPERTAYTSYNGLFMNLNYLQIMDLYFKCCRMKQTKDDNLSCLELLSKYGVLG
jgi:hypothetical protein